MSANPYRNLLGDTALEVLHLRHQRKTYQQIADQIGTTRYAAKSIHDRAIEKLVYVSLQYAGLLP